MAICKHNIVVHIAGYYAYTAMNANTISLSAGGPPSTVCRISNNFRSRKSLTLSAAYGLIAYLLNNPGQDKVIKTGQF
jgi:hypothetical protein